MSTYIKWFKDLHKEDVAIAGGKASNLGEMWNAGFPVPNGFVVLTRAYKDFIKENKFEKEIRQKLKDLDYEDTDKLQKVAEEIQKLILEGEVSDDIKEEVEAAYSMLDTNSELHKIKTVEKLILAGRELSYVAVRSSASAEDLPGYSFAGQMSTFLNIKGQANLLQAVRACWASLFTARAIYYRQKNNLSHTKIAIAVVVQKQILSEKSGIIFTINPATNNQNELVIEAIYGLGEAVVSGAVNPNTYVLDKSSGEVLEKDLPEQDFFITRDEFDRTLKKNLSDLQKQTPVLNEKELDVLFKLAKKVEAHYNFPQDIEWAIERGKIYLVQTRPVTTIEKKIEIKEEEFGQEILSGLGASGGIATGIVKIISSPKELDKIQKGDILVTEMTNPDYVPAMQKAVAIVTDRGGITAHAAIVSREMGIPCVVGTKEATKVLKDGDLVTVDGNSGKVYKGEIKIEKKEAAVGAEKIETKTQVKVNVDLPIMAERAAATGADGIGLLRLEGIIASGKIHPAKYLHDNKLDEYEKLIYEGIKEIVTKFKDTSKIKDFAVPAKSEKDFVGKPVWIRTSDIRTDEYRELEGGELEPKESNPMIGWHGIRRSLDNPELLKAEFSAIKKLYDEGFTKIGIMLPFVISVDDIRKAKEILREVWFNDRSPIVIPIEFGVMIETPASVFIIEELCKERIDFISLGTNDLTQTILGVDRNNENIAKLYNENHPAVLKAIEHVIKICKSYKVKTSICGQAGSDPKMAELLVKLGIDSISANIDSVHIIRKIVYEAELTNL